MKSRDVVIGETYYNESLQENVKVLRLMRQHARHTWLFAVENDSNTAHYAYAKELSKIETEQ